MLFPAKQKPETCQQDDDIMFSTVKKLLSPIATTAGEPLNVTTRRNSQHKQSPSRAAWAGWAAMVATFLCLANGAWAASVGPGGYANDFATRPAPADFSTSGGIAGASGDIADAAALDAYVQNVAASSITTQVTDSSPANPPTKLAAAQWTSGGSAYLVTRSTGNRATVLMATLVNNTGTNCNMLHFNYQLTVGASFTEEVPGQRLYYSFSTAANTWTTLPAVSGLNASGPVSADVPLNQMWNTGSALYLLWVDDNAADSTESAYEIDNFFAAAYYTNVPLSITLTAPANGQHFGLGTVISARVALTGSPTNVSYYVDDSLAVARTTAPFTPVPLPAQTLGTHTAYATAQDASNTFVTTMTNTFVVDVSLSGTLSTNTTLYTSNSPYTVAGTLTVPGGITLTIQPGVTVQFASGAGITVSGGQLIAAGTPAQRIKFTKQAGGGSWAGFSISNAGQSNVLAYADMEYSDSGSQSIYINTSQVLIDRMTFFKITKKYLDIWWPQVIIRHSTFGDLGGAYFCTVENLAANGWFIVDGNLLGLDIGDNDIFHLNHISVKNGPKAIIVNNVFTGAGDDHIDDNESDSHIEGNLFLNFTTNHPPRSAAAAVTTGEGSGVSTNLHTQRLTVVRNIFWGCDYGIINKDGSYVEVYNCVFVNNRGAIIFDEPWRTDSGPGRACYIEGSVFWNNWPENGTDQGTFAYLTNSVAWTTGRYYRGATQVTVNNSILPPQYHYLGTGNFDADPMFVYPTNLMSLSPTNPAFAGGFDGFDANAFLFTNHLIPDVHLLPGSPAIGTGVNGSDLGIYVSDDATITGEPSSPTSQTNTTLTVAGLDIGGYKYRLVGPSFTNAWSQELQPWKYVSAITLAGTTATASSTSHGYADGDVIEVVGADSLCPYYNGLFTIRNVKANTFDYTVSPGTNLLTPEPLTITWPIRNEGRTDIWCRRPQKIQLSGLSDGTYRVEAIRKNSMDVWQSADAPTVSKAWTVQTGPGAPHIDSIVPAGGAVMLSFVAQSGLSYSVLASDSLAPAAWQKVQNIDARPATMSLTVTNTMTGPMRFYRLVTPAQP